ncbi:MAG: UvrD-helicase domain-containing protein [Halofilum sp. (in: g-proteobacteria)]|nr:UvrD-helicase domain-containing protein [Halofilum sp. (in: g-proteobacteria)]
MPLDGIRLVEASAGTGKTFSLAGLYLRLIVEQRLDGARHPGDDLHPRRHPGAARAPARPTGQGRAHRRATPDGADARYRPMPSPNA